MKKTYNEFRKMYADDMKKLGDTTLPEKLSEAWKDYKLGKYKTVKKAPVTTKKVSLPESVKKINIVLTSALNKVFELRKQKKDGKDVKDELQKNLKILTDKRIEKKTIMENLVTK